MKREKQILKKNQNGFSLVEILLAIVILSLIMTPILQIFVSSMNISNRSRRLLGATEVAQMTLEVLNSKPMDGAGGIQEMLTQAGSYTFLPAMSNYNTTNTSMGSVPADHDSFVTALQGSYVTNPNEICITAISEGEKFFALHNIVHNGYVYDVVVSMESNGVTTDKYFTYDVFLEVYEAEAGNHYSKRLLTMESAVLNKY